MPRGDANSRLRPGRYVSSTRYPCPVASDPRLTRHKCVARQLVWMNGLELFSGPEADDGAEPEATASARRMFRLSAGFGCPQKPSDS